MVQGWFVKHVPQLDEPCVTVRLDLVAVQLIPRVDVDSSWYGSFLFDLQRPERCLNPLV